MSADDNRLWGLQLPTSDHEAPIRPSQEQLRRATRLGAIGYGLVTVVYLAAVGLPGSLLEETGTWTAVGVGFGVALLSQLMPQAQIRAFGRGIACGSAALAVPICLVALVAYPLAS